MNLGIKVKRWKSTDNIYGSGFGASDIKLLEAGPGIPSLQKAVGRNELHSYRGKHGYPAPNLRLHCTFPDRARLLFG